MSDRRGAAHQRLRLGLGIEHGDPLQDDVFAGDDRQLLGDSSVAGRFVGEEPLECVVLPGEGGFSPSIPRGFQQADAARVGLDEPAVRFHGPGGPADADEFRAANRELLLAQALRIVRQGDLQLIVAHDNVVASGGPVQKGDLQQEDQRTESTVLRPCMCVLRL